MTDTLTNAVNEAAAKPEMTLARAMEIFDWLADMEDIAFGYSYGGCHARSHIMCQRLATRGVIPRKIWAFESLERLTVPFTSSLSGEIFPMSWYYHTAPVLSVTMPDKTTQDMVMDPSLFDGPATIEEWTGIMGATPEKVQLLDRGATPKGCLGNYNPGMPSNIAMADRDAKETMERNVPMQEKGPRKLFPSRSREMFFRSQDGKFKGKTWVTAPFSDDVKEFLKQRAAASRQPGVIRGCRHHENA